EACVHRVLVAVVITVREYRSLRSVPDETSEPVRGELLDPLGPLLRRDGEPHVVLPDAVDLEVALGDAFVADLELLDDAPAGAVAGDDRDLDAVQVQLLEREPGDHHDGFGNVALAGVPLVDPVADVGALERAPLQRRQVDLAGEGAVDEDPEPVGGAELALPLAC